MDSMEVDKPYTFVKVNTDDEMAEPEVISKSELANVE